MEEKTAKKRRHRSDRMHVIYQLTCVPTGERYIGVTVCAGNSPKRAAEGRWKRHVTRALFHDKSWKLCEAIRAFGPEAFFVEVLEKVRGKAQAHQREREITKLVGAELNMA